MARSASTVRTRIALPPTSRNCLGRKLRSWSRSSRAITLQPWRSFHYIVCIQARKALKGPRLCRTTMYDKRFINGQWSMVICHLLLQTFSP